MKYLLALIVALTACENKVYDDEKAQNVTQNFVPEKPCPVCPKCNTTSRTKVDADCGEVYEQCFNGVIYYANNCGIAPRINKDVSVVGCDYKSSIKPEYLSNDEEHYD